MANIRLGSIVSDIRGKVGDEVYSRNAAGLYVRSPGDWIQPDTQRQLDQRAAVTAVSQAWSGTLTEQQRSDWRKYGQQWPRPNRLGDVGITAGYLAFLRHNLHHYRAYESLGFADAPTAGPIHRPSFTFTAAADETATIALPPTAYDPPPTDLRLYLYGGEPTAVGVSYFSGPWRYIGVNTHCGGCLTVTGNPDPDATGTYAQSGTHNSHAVYSRTDSAFHIYYPTLWPLWTMSQEVTDEFLDCWTSQTLEGTYEANGEYDGEPITADANNWTIYPWTVGWPFPLAAGQRVHAYLIAQLSTTGEISTRARALATVTA